MKIYTTRSQNESSLRYISPNYCHELGVFIQQGTANYEHLVKFYRAKVCVLSRNIGKDYLNESVKDYHAYNSYHSQYYMNSYAMGIIHDIVYVYEVETPILSRYIDEHNLTRWGGWNRPNVLDTRVLLREIPNLMNLVDEYPVLEITKKIGGVRRAYDKVKKLSSGELVLNLQSENHIEKELTKFFLKKRREGNE